MKETTRKKPLVRYIPTTRRRKWITKVTEPHGGLHKQEEFKKGVEMLEYCAHNFRNPRLFHICFIGADVPTYQLVMFRFRRTLTAEGVRFRFKAAVEHDSEKGLHYHVMIVLEAEVQTHRFIRASDESGELENESVLRKAVRHTWNECSLLDYHVSKPRSRHGLPFIQMNQTNQEFFDEAAEWLSYIYKADTKLASGTVYFSDRQENDCSSEPATL